MPSLYVIVVGYDQDAKCKLLNAMNQGERHTFTVMSCKTNLKYRKLKGYTVSGQSITLVQTPSLNTPAWTEQQKKLEGDQWKGRKCVFVYVKAAVTTADDVKCVQGLKKTFAYTQVHCINCYDSKKKNSTPLDPREHVLKEEDIFIHTFGINAVLETRISEALVILKKLKECVECTYAPEPVADSASEVGGKEDATAVHQTSDAQALDPTQVDELIATVEVPDTGPRPRQKMPEDEKLTKDDWDLFGLTLKHGEACSRHIRVNVVGNHAVGKTTLISRLQGENIQCPDPNPTPTENLAIHRVTTVCEQKNGKREWSTGDHESFLEDLNIQRMADAMQDIERSEKQVLNLNVSGLSLNSMNDSLPLSPEDVDNNRSQVEQVSTTPEHSLQTPDSQFRFPVDFDLGDTVFGIGSDELPDEPQSLRQSQSIQTPPAAQSGLSDLRYKEKYLKQVLHTKQEFERKQIERVYISFWDYAGQATYYATHQLFMSPSAVYLLLFDLQKELCDNLTDDLEFRTGVLKSCTIGDSLKFWAHSIKSYTKDENNGNAPFIIVGTHSADISSADIDRKFKNVRTLIDTNAECIAIDNTLESDTDENLELLKKTIIDNGLGVLREKVSSQWINLEYDMQKSHVCQSKGYITFEELKELDKKLDVPMCDTKRLEYFLAHQHSRGHLLFYKHMALKSLIITDPHLLVNFLNSLMRRQQNRAIQQSTGVNENGIVNYQFIQDSAKTMGIEENACLGFLEILINLNILHPFSSTDTEETNDQYFFPCLLPDKQKQKDIDKCSRSPLLQIQFKDGGIHQATYHQIICALLKIMSLIEDRGEKLIYNLHTCFKVKDNTFVWLEVFWENSVINFTVKDFDDEEIPMENHVDYVIEKLEQAMNDVILANHHRNFSYSVYVECPDHRGAFVELKDLKQKGKAFCFGLEKNCAESQRHMVKISDVYGVSSKVKPNPEDPVLLQKPTDKMLGRLAWKLRENEDAKTLTLRLELQNVYRKADIICRDYSEPGSELVFLLVKWRNENKSNGTYEDVLCLLTKQDYDLVGLRNAMFLPRTTDPRLESIPTYASDGNKDIDIVVRYIGQHYIFFLLECGIEWFRIQQYRKNYRDDTTEMIRQLLYGWRKRYPDNSTTKQLLESAYMYETPLDEIITEMQKLR